MRYVHTSNRCSGVDPNKYISSGFPPLTALDVVLCWAQIDQVLHFLPEILLNWQTDWRHTSWSVVSEPFYTCSYGSSTASLSPFVRLLITWNPLVG